MLSYIVHVLQVATNARYVCETEDFTRFHCTLESFYMPHHGIPEKEIVIEKEGGHWKPYRKGSMESYIILELEERLKHDPGFQEDWERYKAPIMPQNNNPNYMLLIINQIRA